MQRGGAGYFMRIRHHNDEGPGQAGMAAAQPGAPGSGTEAGQAAPPAFVTRRRLGLWMGGGAALLVSRAARAGFPPGSAIDGVLPDLAFHMTRTSDGKPVTAADYRGKIVVLYFGFTRCTDTCPLTMSNMALVMRRMGPLAARMRVLFVTVDLGYDTVARLKTFLARFGTPPQIDGLYGTPAELAALAHRCDVSYAAPSGPNSPDPVSRIRHTSLVYVFGPHGRSRDLLADLNTGKADLAAIAEGFEAMARAIA